MKLCHEERFLLGDVDQTQSPTEKRSENFQIPEIATFPPTWPL